MSKNVLDEEGIARVAVMTELSQQLRTYIEANPGVVFSLNGPASLTVKRRNNEYRHEDENGGEQFTPVSTYVGKRGTILVTFKPKAPKNYVTMEMELANCHQNLNGFTKWAGPVFDLDQESIENRVKATAEKAIKNKFEDPIFASW